MNREAKTEIKRARGDAFTLGLNPYGLAYHLGLQGAGSPRANPKGAGLNGFIAIAIELGARTLEIFDPWLRVLATTIAGAPRPSTGARHDARRSSGLMMGPFESALRSARFLDAKVIRYGLTTVLCGDRNALGDKWETGRRCKGGARRSRPARGRRRPHVGDREPPGFGSGELVAFCEEARGVGICFAPAPSPSPKRRSTHAPDTPHVVHVHLKDYRVQFTDEGYRLIRCAIGDGAVPLPAVLDEIAKHHAKLTAVLEPGALEARHVRLLRPEWWNGYPPKSAEALAACLAAARVNRLPEDADWRTPWERGDDAAIETFELAMIRRSAANMRAIGLALN